jgi:VWFA-related protein
MNSTAKLIQRHHLVLGAALVILLCSIAYGQRPDPTPEDVLRINTELVQTDVTVLDRSGRFVEGLRPEQFQLTLEGKPEAITFFEVVRTGTSAEAKTLAASRGLPPAASQSAPTSSDRRRVIFFFLDDLHLSESSVIRARKALFEFVESQMTSDDLIAVVSTSGQIGFLQQLTDYKPMLRTAIARLDYKRITEAYAGKVPISDYDAIQVADHNDRDLFVYLLLATMNEYQSKGALRRVAINIVKNRTQQVATQARTTALDTIEVLESLMTSSAALPGRKLVFFISDGFITDLRNSNAKTLLKRVTDLAAREGAVVYTMDARGTVTDARVDAGRNDFPEGLATGTEARHPNFEEAATQEPLHILADDTGGRAIIHSNSFKDAFRQAIDETSSYYLLGWRPDNEEQRNGRAKIKITVKDRPDLRVRLRNNYYAPPEVEKKAEAPKEPETPEAGLLKTLAAAYPQRNIKTSLSVGYVNLADAGLALRASMQIDRNSLNFAEDEKQKTFDVIGAAVDDRGLIVTFKQVLNVANDRTLQSSEQPIIWNQQLKLQPGLYQVRVAVRERESGLTGSVQQWIEVPDFAKPRLLLSSIFLAERKAARLDEKFATGAKSITVNVDHRFARSSVLRFQTYIYNVSGNSTASRDIDIQTRVLRDNRAFITSTPVQVPTNTTNDLTRLPYWSEIALDQLPAGRYTLEVTATDRATKSTASNFVTFVVE